jgi:hypothetical protein
MKLCPSADLRDDFILLPRFGCIVLLISSSLYEYITKHGALLLYCLFKRNPQGRKDKSYPYA